MRTVDRSGEAPDQHLLELPRRRCLHAGHGVDAAGGDHLAGRGKRAQASGQVGGGADHVELATLADVAGVADQAGQHQALRDADAEGQGLRGAHRSQLQPAAQGQVGASHPAEHGHHAIARVLDHRALRGVDARGLLTENLVEHGEKLARRHLRDQVGRTADVGKQYRGVKEFALGIGEPGRWQGPRRHQVGQPLGSIAAAAGRGLHRQQFGEHQVEANRR